MNHLGLAQGNGGVRPPAALLAAAILLSGLPAPVAGGPTPLRGVDMMPNQEDAMLNLQHRSLQATSCLAGSGGLAETFEGPCTSAAISSAVSAAMASAGDSCSGVTLESELFALLGGDAGAPTTAEATAAALSDLCDSGFDDASLPFGKITKRGDQFDREFMNGGSDWNDHYEVDYEGRILHKLSDDADRVRIVDENLASKGPIEFPDYLTNFQGCEVGAAMCCYVSDRQQNDAGGDCSGIGCTDSDPASNTDVCYADMANSPYSTRVSNGFAIYHLNRDSTPAEGNVYCHGFAWDSADPDSDSYKYRGNVLFDVAFKKNLYDKGYVQHVPGAPMCGCVEQMPIVTKADCSKLNSVTETWTLSTDSNGLLVADMTDAVVSYGPCDADEGLAESYAAVNANNTPAAISSHLVGDGNCLDAIDMAMSTRGYQRSVLEAVNAVGDPDGTSVTVTFNTELAASASDKDSYKIYEEATNTELAVWSAELSPDGDSITLVTDPQTAKTAYVIEIVGNVEKAVAPMVKLPSGSKITFDGASYGYAANVDESDGYTLVYSLDIPDKPNYGSGCPPYAFGDVMVKTFSKIAYWMELESPKYGHEFVWVSMDAFTTDLDKIGVPTFDSGAVFQQSLGPVNIVSNQADIGTHTGVEANIEFWPYNYATAPSAASPAGANANTFDFGDTNANSGDHGSMQVHSMGKTLFAFNHWNRGRTASLGIGNNPEGSNPDWTFSETANQYTLKRLQVLVEATSFITDADRAPDGIAATIDDSEGYLMAYDLNIPQNPNYSNKVSYDREYPMSSGITRVAYFAELMSVKFGHQWVWVSMNAFTTDASKTGVPCRNCGQGTIQEHVTNVNIVSNQPGFNGTSLAGNVEFWPFNYGKVNTGAVRGASNNLYDSGDEPVTSGSYGSMQIHVDDPSEPNGVRNTVFAFNSWNSGAVADLGIGRQAVGEPDWTFSRSAGEYTVRKLQVYVK